MTSAGNNCCMSLTKKGRHVVFSGDTMNKGNGQAKCVLRTNSFVRCYPIFLPRKGVWIAMTWDLRSTPDLPDSPSAVEQQLLKWHRLELSPSSYPLSQPGVQGRQMRHRESFLEPSRNELLPSPKERVKKQPSLPRQG